MIKGNLPKEIFSHNVLFISGIDTNIGKTYAAGALAKLMLDQGCKVTTQKMIQTGCLEISEDIEEHRKIMGIPLSEQDLSGVTCPILLSYPASPHLAAEIDNIEIDITRVEVATEELLKDYDTIILEGAGGLMVPINTSDSSVLGGFLTIDYIQKHNYPVILVTSGKLGSLNHTLLSIDACKRRGIKIELIIYNLYPNTDNTITQSSLEYLKALKIPIITLGEIKE